MVDNKTIGINTLIASGLILAFTLVPGFFEEDKYSCDTNDLIVSCDGFSKWVDPNGKCLNATTEEGTNLGNKICRSGWKLIIDDRVPESHLEDTSIIYEDNINREEYQCGTDNKCTMLE